MSHPKANLVTHMMYKNTIQRLSSSMLLIGTLLYMPQELETNRDHTDRAASILQNRAVRPCVSGFAINEIPDRNREPYHPHRFWETSLNNFDRRVVVRCPNPLSGRRIPS